MTKICIICKLEVSEEKFSKRKTSKDGLGSYCKKCLRDKTRLRAQDSKSKEIDTLKVKNRICNVCKLDKDRSEYHNAKTLTGGISYTCKLCAIEKSNKQYINNTKRMNEQAYSWRKANPNKSKIISNRYYSKNKKIIREKLNIYKTKIRPIEYQKHVFRMKVDTLYAQTFRFNARLNAHRRRARKFLNDMNCNPITKQEWEDLQNRCNRVCLKCGKDSHIVMDHVIPIFHGGNSSLSNIQPLCNSCNASKGATYVEYRPWILEKGDLGVTYFDASFSY